MPTSSKGGEHYSSRALAVVSADTLALAPDVLSYPNKCSVHPMENEDLLKRITLEPGKCGGRPCTRGYRIRVTDILELLGAGASIDEILADYDFLEREDVLAAIEYAAHQAGHPALLAS